MYSVFSNSITPTYQLQYSRPDTKHSPSNPRKSINIHPLIKAHMPKRLPILRQPIMTDEYKLACHIFICFFS